MKFENWKEAYQYILDNTDKSCLNCRFGTNGKKDIENDTCSPFVFCTKTIQMANLNFGVVCPNDWEMRK